MEKVFNETITVVVPVYMVEKYLDRCINSIINQTYTKLEIILVDDGSKDNCPKMCDEWEKKDKRIKVIHKKNGGLSDARNYGIEKANGEYITFVDSDDYLSDDCIQVLFDNLKKYDSDISIGGHKVIYDSGKEINRFTNKEFVDVPEKILEKILYDDGIDLSAWAKLYKTSLFKKIKYPVGRLYEDAATTYKLIDNCNKISVISKPVYYYIIRNDSITNYEFSIKKLDLITSTEEMTNYINNKYPNLIKACKRRMMYAYLSTITQMVKSKSVDGKIKRRLLNYVKKNLISVLLDNKVPKRDKMGILSLCFGVGFFKFFWKIYSIIR